MSRLEKKWWFILVVSVLTTFTTRYVLEAAGLPSLRNLQPAQWAVYLLCFFGTWRGFSYLGWLVVLFFAPSLVIQQHGSSQ